MGGREQANTKSHVLFRRQPHCMLVNAMLACCC